MKSNEVRLNWRDVIDYVRHGGHITVEHYNRPVARIIPIEEPAVTFTSRDLRDQVKTATDASDGEYDVDAIVEDIVDRYGAIPVDDIESGEFWQIVGDHRIEGDPS